MATGHRRSIRGEFSSGQNGHRGARLQLGPHRGGAGKCGVPFEQERVDIDIMGMPVCRAGLTVPFDEDEALRRFEAPEIVIEADLGAGTCSTTVWTCDLTHEYVSINADYRS